MKGCRGKKGQYVVRAKKSLLEDSVWRPKLRGYPLSLVCSIREKLLKRIPGITEKFNTKSRYFGYWLGDDKDRVYIYVQKGRLLIDLCIGSDYATALKKQGYKVKPRDNFQGQKDWLTGWHVPHSAEDLKQIVNWLCKAFEEKFMI